MDLYGFSSQEELNMFELLISVSGVGPKAAMAILSVLTPQRLSGAVMSGDAKSIAKANGVGAKTAARVVLELKDKIGKAIGSAPADGGGSLMKDIPDTGNSTVADAQAALMVLGYSRAEANYALASLDSGLDTETLIREGLKRLMK